MAGITPQVKLDYDPETMGYGKHTFDFIDPETIDPADYLRPLRVGQVDAFTAREVCNAYNERHPNTTFDLYEGGILGSRFSTEAEGFEGQWEVVDLPKVKAPLIWLQCRQVAPTGLLVGPLVLIDPVLLGIVADEANFYKQVVSKLISVGKKSREQRKLYVQLE